MRPSPHLCQTWHRSPRGPRVWVVPAPATPEATARSWRSSPPSPQARLPASRWRARGDVEQLMEESRVGSSERAWSGKGVEMEAAQGDCQVGPA
jgi:hypothetical protein